MCSLYSPTLTWRDVQYLIAYTSKHTPLVQSDQWRQNGGGLWISEHFGFGAIDAEAMVSRARNWITVPEQHSYSFVPSWTSGQVDIAIVVRDYPRLFIYTRTYIYTFFLSFDLGGQKSLT